MNVNEKDKKIKIYEWDDYIEEDGEPGPTDETKKPGMNPAQELERYLTALFNPSECVGYVVKSRKDEQRNKYIPGDRGTYYRTAGDLIAGLRSKPDDIEATIGDYNHEAGAWIRFNPLDGSGVGNDNVTSYRYALVESDNISTDKQKAIIEKLRLPVAVMVSSGGKSVHAIVKINAASSEEYRERVEYLYYVCDKKGLEVDKQNKNPSRLSRMPGVFRGEKRQYIITENIGCDSFEEWQRYAAETLGIKPEEEQLEEDFPEYVPENIGAAAGSGSGSASWKREEAERIADRIRRMKPVFLSRDKSKKGWICPICGSGSGKNGTGISNYAPGKYKCHACGLSGDIFDLIGAWKGVNGFKEQFAEACRYYNERNPWEYAGAVPEPRQKQRVEKAAEPMEQEKKEEEITTEEEKERIIEERKANIEKWQKAFSDPATPEGMEYMKSRGLEANTCTSAGVGYDPERKCVIFPRFDFRYNSRSLTAHTFIKTKSESIDNGKAMPAFNRKYLNFYSDNIVYVTEGEIDAITMESYGKRAAACGGADAWGCVIDAIKASHNYGADTHKATDKSGLVIVCAFDNDRNDKEKTDEKKEKSSQAVENHIEKFKNECIAAGIRLFYDAHLELWGSCKDANEAHVSDFDNFWMRIEAVEANIAAELQRIEEEERQEEEKKHKLPSASEWLHDSFEASIDQFSEYKDRKTGYDNIDEQQPFYPGLYIVGGNTSLGKTTFLVQLAEQLAKNGEEVIYFALEQTSFELISKGLARRFHELADEKAQHRETCRTYSAVNIRSGLANYDPNLKTVKERYINDVGDRLHIIEGMFDCTVEQIRARVEDFIQYYGKIPTVIIDYLQIITPTEDTHGRRMDARASIDHIAHTLKQLQSKYSMTMICVSAFNRENYITAVDMTSFKESGGLEYTCDVMIGLQLEGMNGIKEKESDKEARRKKIAEYMEETPRMIEVKFLKNRNGRTRFSVCFEYYPANDRFISADPPAFKDITNEVKKFGFDDEIEDDGRQTPEQREKIKISRVYNIIRNKMEVGEVPTLEAVAEYFKNDKGYSKRSLRNLARSQGAGFFLDEKDIFQLKAQKDK